MGDWKQQHANDCDAALMHPLVRDVIEEQMENLVNCCGVSRDDGLVRYGLSKIAMYAAQSARAMALGFDPDLLRATESESNAHMMKMAEAFVKAGKPVIVVVPPTEEPTQ